MSFISSAELVILRKMYPEGCRVSLERMVDEPYAKLHPGDLGTVRNVDDAGRYIFLGSGEQRSRYI